MDRHARRSSEQRFEVRQTEARHVRQLGEREILVEMRLDVFDHTAQPPCRQRAQACVGRCRLRRLQSEQSRRECAAEAIREQAAAGIAVVIFRLHHPADALDLRIADVIHGASSGSPAPIACVSHAITKEPGRAAASVPAGTRSSASSTAPARRRTGHESAAVSLVATRAVRDRHRLADMQAQDVTVANRRFEQAHWTGEVRTASGARTVGWFVIAPSFYFCRALSGRDSENHPPVSEVGRRRSPSASPGRTLARMKRRQFIGLTGAARSRARCVWAHAVALAGCGWIPCDAALCRSGLRADCLCRARVGRAAVFLHGAPLNGFQWRGAIERLSAQRRCIALDFMGLGYSEIPQQQSLAADAQADMLATFLDALEIRTVDIVASDSGGAVAQLFVRHRSACAPCC